MTLLTILGVTEILCSFKLVIKGKTGKEIPWSWRFEFLERLSANNFALSDAEDNSSGLLNRGGIENTIGNSPKVTRAKFLGSDGIFCFINICNFGSFKDTFTTITILSELYFRFRRFIFLVQTKKVISMNYGSSRSSWKPWRWVRLDLILSIRDAHINSNLTPLKKFTSSRSPEFKDILPWNISQMITKTIPISTRIVIRNAMKQGIRCEYNGKSMETETITWSIFLNGGTAIVEQILVSEEINPKEQDCENQCGILVGKLTIWVRLFEIIITTENYNRAHQIYQFHQNR